MNQRTFIIAIVAGMVIGSLIGVFTPGFGLAIFWLGELFLKALKMLVIPLIVSSMVVGVAGLGDVRKLGRAGSKTLGYYVLTTFLAVAVGMLLVNVIRPGARSHVEAQQAAVERAQAVSTLTPGQAAQRLVESLIPANVIRAAADGKVLPLIVVSLLFGAALSTTGSRGEVLYKAFVGLNETVMKLVHVVVAFAPLGILALVAGRFGKTVMETGGPAGLLEEFSRLGWYMGTVVAGLSVHGFVILPLILLLVARRNPWRFATGMSPALLTAFSTASSSATLPLTMDRLVKKNKVPSKAVSLVAPMGATINMDGTALYEAVAATFIAQSYGIELGLTQQLTLFLTATLAAVGAAGIPEAGLVTMVMVLQAVGLPLEGIALILVVDWLLDRFRTTVNVWGDSVGAAVLERWEFRADSQPTGEVI